VKQLEQAGYAPTDVKRILITHAHPDHVGGLDELARITGAEVTAHEIEAPVVAGEAPMLRPGGVERAPTSATPVNRTVKDGEVLEEFEGGMQMVFVPGHAPGQVAYWWPSRGIIFSGDVMMHMPWGLTLPLAMATVDMEEAKRSIRRVATLNPKVICPGHGTPITQNAARQARQFAVKLGMLD